MTSLLKRPGPLDVSYNVNNFNCKEENLNKYLKIYATLNNKNNSAKTYVSCRGINVVGYYSLVFGSVFREEATSRVVKGLAKHPIPVIILARLAVDVTEQRQGLGKALLKDSLIRTLQAADIAGLRAIVVHAKNTAAKEYYESFGFFEPSPTNPLHLFLMLKDIPKML